MFVFFVFYILAKLIAHRHLAQKCVECCKRVLARKLREIMGKILKINQEWYIFAEVNIAKFAFYEV